MKSNRTSTWKQRLCVGLLTCTLLAVPVSAATFMVDGQTLSSGQMQIISLNDRNYVPLRAFSQLLDPTVTIEWDNATRTARVTSERLDLTARVGEQWLVANGQYFYAADGIRCVNGSVMVPIRTLTAAMGAVTEWEAAACQVTVTSGSGAPDAETYTEEDVYWLSRIISAESQGESLEGKLAVGNVVLNRVASEEFPSSIYEVIFDRKWGTQFTPVDNGAIYWQPTEESVVAAKLCLNGTNIAGKSLYFLDPSKSSNLWAVEHCDFVTAIGCHHFYA